MLVRIAMCGLLLCVTGCDKQPTAPRAGMLEVYYDGGSWLASSVAAERRIDTVCTTVGCVPRNVVVINGSGNGVDIELVFEPFGAARQFTSNQGKITLQRGLGVPAYTAFHFVFSQDNHGGPMFLVDELVSSRVIGTFTGHLRADTATNSTPTLHIHGSYQAFF